MKTSILHFRMFSMTDIKIIFVITSNENNLDLEVNQYNSNLMLK